MAFGNTIANVGTYLFDSYAWTSSNRQDLVDWIANISPFETPLLNSIGKTEARSTIHQWQKDSLRGRNARNIQEGRVFGFTAPTAAPSRLTNQCEIFGDDIVVTESQRAEDPAGFADTYAYNLEKSTKAVMVDLETALMAIGTSATGSSGVGRVMKSLNDFITTNKYTGASYTGLAGTATTAGVFNAADVNAMLNLIWNQGGNTDLIVMNGAYKRQFSALTATNTRNILAEQKKLVIGIDIYDSDFGLMPIQLNRWSPVSTNTASATAGLPTDLTGRVWFLQRSLIRVAWFRPLAHRLMGTPGDYTAGQLTAECTLEVGNEAGLGVFSGVNNKSLVS